MLVFFCFNISAVEEVTSISISDLSPDLAGGYADYLYYIDVNGICTASGFSSNITYYAKWYVNDELKMETKEFTANYISIPYTSAGIDRAFSMDDNYFYVQKTSGQVYKYHRSNYSLYEIVNIGAEVSSSDLYSIYVEDNYIYSLGQIITTWIERDYLNGSYSGLLIDNITNSGQVVGLTKYNDTFIIEDGYAPVKFVYVNINGSIMDTITTSQTCTYVTAVHTDGEYLWSSCRKSSGMYLYKYYFNGTYINEYEIWGSNVGVMGQPLRAYGLFVEDNYYYFLENGYTVRNMSIVKQPLENTYPHLDNTQISINSKDVRALEGDSIIFSCMATNGSLNTSWRNSTVSYVYFEPTITPLELTLGLVKDESSTFNLSIKHSLNISFDYNITEINNSNYTVTASPQYFNVADSSGNYSIINITPLEKGSFSFNITFNRDYDNRSFKLPIIINVDNSTSGDIEFVNPTSWLVSSSSRDTYSLVYTLKNQGNEEVSNCSFDVGTLAEYTTFSNESFDLGVNESINVTVQVSTSNDGTYSEYLVTSCTANDYGSDQTFNSPWLRFIVAIQGYGGSGGEDKIIFIGKSNVSVESKFGSESFKFIMSPNSKITENLILRNYGTETKEVLISCQSETNFCDYITFSKKNLTVEPNSLFETPLAMTINLPKDINESTYYYGVVASVGNSEDDFIFPITVEVNKKKGIITSLGTKFLTINKITYFQKWFPEMSPIPYPVGMVAIILAMAIPFILGFIWNGGFLRISYLMKGKNPPKNLGLRKNKKITFLFDIFLVFFGFGIFILTLKIL